MIDPAAYGISFSIKQCRNFALDPKKTLHWLSTDAGFKRFRVMSYWDEYEKTPGTYNFDELDWQVDMISKTGGQISLCLGARQPRWPENHWPDWAWQDDTPTRSGALLAYIGTVVNRYKNNSTVVSYQLENEALLKAFGEQPEVDRARLRQEFELVKRLDPSRPIIMTTSTSWGIPLRQPIPDIVGFSYYRMIYGKQGYSTAFHFPLVHRIRKLLISLIWHRPVFIHELQLEPWGPSAIWEMPVSDQNKSMSPEMIQRNIQLAQKVKAPPIDLWGGEWWYWRLRHGDATIWETVRAAIIYEKF